MSISWSSCAQNASVLPLSCGTLQVPLDYTAANSSQHIQLNLVKINATIQPSKGSVLLDFGGPGSSNINQIANSNGQALLTLTGGIYDLVAFEPRGTGTTKPYSCYNSSEARAAGVGAIPQALDESRTTLEKGWAAANALADTCYRNNAEMGELIGTTFVARDTMQIVDALEEDGLLRYYGFSWGTVLGATVAAMFPDRMERLVFDGVMNPTDYWDSPLPPPKQIDSDQVLAGFFKGCIESPHLCALAQNVSSAGELSRSFMRILSNLKLASRHPANESATAVNYGSLLPILTEALYFPPTWASFATGLARVLNGNLSSLPDVGDETFIYGPPTFADDTMFELTPAVVCADKSFRTEELDDLLPLLSAYAAESRAVGDLFVATGYILMCARWKLASKERYTGGFHDIQTKSPVLVVGNSVDPTTPLASARNVSESFAGSGLLQNNGFGHTTIGSPSVCTAQYIRAYFINGTLPPRGTVCNSITLTQPFAYNGSYYVEWIESGRTRSRTLDKLAGLFLRSSGRCTPVVAAAFGAWLRARSTVIIVAVWAVCEDR